MIVLTALFGCAGNQTYVEPTDSSMAVIELINNTNGSVTGPFIYEKPQCSDRKFAAPMLLKEKSKSIKVKPGEEVTFSVMMPESTGSNILVGGFGALGLLASDSMYKDCKPIIGFEPKPNYRYVMIMNSTEKGCEYSFKSMLPSGEEEPGFQFKARKFSRPFADAGPWCE